MLRIEANENVPLDVVEALREGGHDVAWVRTIKPGARDREVLQHAQMENRLLLTFDKDFGELAFRSALPAACGIVLLRMPLKSSKLMAHEVVSLLESRNDWAGNFTVFDGQRIRMVPLPRK